MTHHAACSCGQLHLTIEGEPSRNAMCHCLACQRRTGAVISNQARFRNEQVTITGKSTAWKRTADSGNVMTFHFCPTCGSTVFWENAGFPGLVSVAIGNLPTRVSRRQPSPSGRSRATRGLTCPQIPQQSEHLSRGECTLAGRTLRCHQPRSRNRYWFCSYPMKHAKN